MIAKLARAASALATRRISFDLDLQFERERDAAFSPADLESVPDS